MGDYLPVADLHPLAAVHEPHRAVGILEERAVERHPAHGGYRGVCERLEAAVGPVGNENRTAAHGLEPPAHGFYRRFTGAECCDNIISAVHEKHVGRPEIGLSPEVRRRDKRRAHEPPVFQIFALVGIQGVPPRPESRELFLGKLPAVGVHVILSALFVGEHERVADFKTGSGNVIGSFRGGGRRQTAKTRANRER